ncbi:hypothetical protein TrCOL_g3994 [Triparma columacea]|uniref:C3H1-type domain-containing protein n=1 Tax=Triparma columacea TaxID=722753 RepID=A0A9W7LF65_9STRA|nr:hypothetical protein TrCOL_g3994 [Triparma columacea]
MTKNKHTEKSSNARNNSIGVRSNNNKNNGASFDSFVQHTTTRIVSSRAGRGPHTKRLRLVSAWLQDVSGSMSGQPEREAIGGLRLLHDDVLEKEDCLAVITFGTSVNVLHEPMRVSKVDRVQDERNIRRSAGGMTAIYDALMTCILGLKEKLGNPKFHQVNKDALYQLILVTDGADNSSKAGLDEVAALVARPGIPNFHLVVVGIGMDRGTAATLRSRLCAPEHAQYMEAPDIGRLGSTLRRVVQDVKARLVVEVQTVRVVVNGGGCGGAGGDAMVMLTQNMGEMGLAAPAGSRRLPLKSLGNGGGGGWKKEGGGGRGRKTLTCTFWEKGKCTKGAACRFKHG